MRGLRGEVNHPPVGEEVRKKNKQRKEEIANLKFEERGKMMETAWKALALRKRELVSKKGPSGGYCFVLDIFFVGATRVDYGKRAGSFSYACCICKESASLRVNTLGGFCRWGGPPSGWRHPPSSANQRCFSDVFPGLLSAVICDNLHVFYNVF